MNSACPLFCCVLALTFFVRTGQGQTTAQSPTIPSKSKIEGLLLSNDPKSIAWGAHYAVLAGDQSLLPDLLSVAAKWQLTSESSGEDDSSARLTAAQLDERDSTAAILDDLIVMDASVPVTTLRSLAKDFPNFVAILLSRLPLEESQPLSLELYRSDIKNGYSLQYVSAALLAQAPPSGFVADLLSSIHVRARIFVTKPGVEVKQHLRGGSLGCVDVPHDQWPSFGIYTLSQYRIADALIVPLGGHPVYAVRSETIHYRNDACEMTGVPLVLGPEQKLGFLAQMLGIEPDRFGWKIEIQQNIEFNSDQQFFDAVHSFVALQQQQYKRTAAALFAKNLMTTSEQEKSLPQLDMYIEDQRGSDYTPIEKPSFLPSNVMWSLQSWNE